MTLKENLTCRAARGASVGNPEAVIPIGWIVLAVTADQRLVFLAEVDAQAAPNAVVVVFTDPAFNEQRGHDAVRHRQAPLAAGRQRILAVQVTVSDIDLEIILQIISKVDLIEEPRLRVISLKDPTDDGGSVVAGLDAGHALQRPLPEIIFAFTADVAGVHPAGLVPRRV